MSYVLYLCLSMNTLGQCLREHQIVYPTEDACRVHLAELRFTGMSVALAFCRPNQGEKP